MVQPINYTVDVQTPFQAAAQGYQFGAAVRNDQLQMQQQQAALAQQQALQAARAQAFQSPTADNFARLMAMDPKSSEAYQRAWTTKNTEQQQSLASDLLQWGAAIKSGKPQVAAEALTRRADMLEQQNGGQPTQDSRAMRLQAQLAAEHPEFALGQIQALLAANPNGKDAAETLAKFGTEQRAAEQAPGALRKVNADADKAVADAATAGVDAKFAEQKAVLDLQKKGWDIKAIQEDIGFKREANRIAAMNAAAAREGNALRREELKLKVQEARNALDDKIRTKQADVESAAGTIDNLINTVDRLKKNPSLDDVVGSIEGRMPAVFGDENADAVALIETLGSQTFLAQIPAMKGLGALSEKEGDKLQSSLQNLSRAQSERQFRANLDEVQRLMLKARKNVETRYGIKAGPPDTPAVQTPAADIDALVNKYLNPQPPGAR
jgi:hypothetical protein